MSGQPKVTEIYTRICEAGDDRNYLNANVQIILIKTQEETLEREINLKRNEGIIC